MDLKEQIILEYLQQGCGYRQLQAKYGIGCTTICKWVQIYQGIHDIREGYICRKKLLHLKSSCNGKNSGLIPPSLKHPPP